MILPGSVFPKNSAAVVKALAALIIIIACLSPAGCTGPTTYTKADPYRGSGYGYRDKRIGGDEFSIVASGNKATTRRRVAEIALLRAARLTKEEGRTHFLITKFKTEAVESAKTTSFPLMIGGIPVPVPIHERSDTEPMAILLIRLLPLTLPYPEGALDADKVIGDLTGKTTD